MIYLCGKPLDVTIFPDKTSQVWQIPQHFTRQLDSVSVRWKFENEGEFIHLAQLRMLLANFGVRPTLYLPYLPYGRQDKEIGNTTTFALHAFAALINTLDFKEVIITDPHSKIALNLIKNSTDKYPFKEVREAMEKTGSNLACYPDDGARTKYWDKYPWKYCYGEKVRDQLTGNILSYKLQGGCSGDKVMIIDDICDGGATFKILAKELLKAGAKEVNLFVTNGIFSKGIKTLYDSGITHIFTQDGDMDKGI